MKTKLIFALAAALLAGCSTPQKPVVIDSLPPPQIGAADSYSASWQKWERQTFSPPKK